MSAEKKSSYGQILKSSSLVGGSQAVGMALGFVRTKVLAVILGAQAPAAVGLLGMFTTLTQMVNSLAGLGASGSGVREISLAYNSSDEERFASVLKALRRLLLGVGIIGGTIMLIMAPWLSRWSFGNEDQTNAIRLLSFTVLFSNINVGQNALLQGRRMLAKLALMGIWSGVLGTIISIGLYFWLGIQAVVPSLVILAALAPVVGWFYSRRVPVVTIRQSWGETAIISKQLISLGISFLAAGLIGIGVTWLVQMQITRVYGENGLGQYSAAYRISGMFVSFILSAMMTDFFPRLTAASNDEPLMTSLINEQVEVGVLMSLPAIIGMLCFAEWIIPVFYTREFNPAVPMFRWLVLGCLGKVCSWPLGTVFAAQGAARKILVFELAAACIHLSGVWLGMKYYGLLGASAAFCILHLICFAWLYMYLHKLIHFAYTRACLEIFGGVVLFLLLTGISTLWLPWPLRILAGILITLFASIWCLRMMVQRIGAQNALVQRIVSNRVIRRIVMTR